MIWQFATAGRVVYGRGTTAQIGSFTERLRVARPLIVTDPILIELGIVHGIAKSLEASGCSVETFSGCVPEPPYECAVDGSRHAEKHRADAIVAIGGGSNIDVAKMMAILVRHGGQPSDYFGFDRVPGAVLPVIACPTTAGTGSEVSNSSVLTDRVAGIKVSSLSQHLRPAVAIVDPVLTDSCPSNVSAHSGIDALVHAIEAVTARSCDRMPTTRLVDRAYEGSNPFTRVLGLEAIRLIGRSIIAAVTEPGNRGARDDMALAALMAGMAFSNSGVALVHALEYPVGARTHCSHGEGNGLLLPHVMRFNVIECAASMALVAEALCGLPPGTASVTRDPLSVAAQAIERVEQLQSVLGIRRQLRQLGLERAQIPEMASKSFAIKRLMDTNPRAPLESDLIAILEAAY